MTTVAEESEVDFEGTARIATEAFGSKDVTFSPSRMRWLYERAFGRGSTVIAAYDEEGKKVGQIVMLHQNIYLDGRPVVATQLIDLFVLKAHRSPTLIRRIYKEVERRCEARNIRIIITTPNETSAPLNARFLKLRPLLSLQVRVGISFGLSFPNHVKFSGRLENISRDAAIGHLSGFITLPDENGIHWDAATLFDRMSDPASDYAIHATDNLLLLSSSRTARGIPHALLCGFFARPDTVITPYDIRALIRSACLTWKHRVFVYAGLNNSLPYQPGFAAPKRLRSPISVQLRDITSADDGAPRFDRFQLIDSDFI